GTTTSDCAGAPYSDASVTTWACHNDRCMVPITPSMDGYLASSPTSNFRTEFDTAGGLLALTSCTPVDPGTPLSDGSLGVCRTVLENALVAHGVDSATAKSWVNDPSMAANRQFGCVVPQRPNCGG